MLADLLGSRTRARLLTLFLMHPDDEFYLREAVRAAKVSLSPAQNELARLSELGVLTERRRGSNRYFRANRHHPLFQELRSVVLKTAGIGDLLRAQLATVAGIACAFVYGSVASGDDNAGSDVDILIVGNVAYEALGEADRAMQDASKRPVRFVVFTPDEVRERAAGGQSFIREVLASPKLFLIGGEDDLARLGAGRPDQAGAAQQG